MKTWKQQVIVITGASSGTGRAIATRLATKMPTLVLAARREPALEEVARECRESGANVHVMITDMRDANQVEHLAKFAGAITGSIDVWINNAGVLAAGALEDVPPAVSEQVVLTNLVGYINGAHQAIPYFKQQGQGILINNISVGGWFPTPYAAAYSASKFGLRGFSESLKGELSNYSNIHVIDLYPGFLDTPGIQHAANYTGKVLKPAPPVYDPYKVANAIVELIESPKSTKIIGSASGLLKLAYALAPKFSRNITAMVIRKYLRQAEQINSTPGNVIQPLEFGRSVHGGWDKKTNPRKSVVAAALIAAVVAGIVTYRSK